MVGKCKKWNVDFEKGKWTERKSELQIFKRSNDNWNQGVKKVKCWKWKSWKQWNEKNEKVKRRERKGEMKEMKKWNESVEKGK